MENEKTLTFRNRIKSNTPVLYPFLSRIYFKSLSLLRSSIANELGLVDPTEKFRTFRPNSAGSHGLISDLTVLSINQITPFLLDFLKSVTDKKTVRIYSIKEFCDTLGKRENVSNELKEMLDKYGSDKALKHNYHLVYSNLFKDRTAVKGMLEIGLGTNHTNIASNMGKEGQPGASLRAFRAFFPNAKIYGADVDDTILFEEERIKTFFVDQTNPTTFEQLNQSTLEKLDLIIDDGLHAPNANIATLTYALSKIRDDGGWFIIEDIPKSTTIIWEMISYLLPEDQYKAYIIQTKADYMFACQKFSK